MTETLSRFAVLVLDSGEVTILQELLLLYKVKPRFMGQKHSDLVDRIYAGKVNNG